MVFLFLVGVILLTGASLASAIRATGSGVADTTRMLKAPPAAERRHRGAGAVRAARVAAAPRARAAGADRAGYPRGGPVAGRAAGRGNPTPVPRRARCDQSEDSRTRTRRTRPRRTPIPGVAVTDPEQLTPQGRLREAVTDDPDFVWELPPAREAADALDGRADAPGHRRAGAHRDEPGRGARALRRAGEGDRDGRGAAHHPLRAAAGAGHEGRQGRAAEGRPRLRAGGDRHPHPRADPRQAGGGRRGAERAPADREARRRLPAAAEGLVAADGVAGQGRGRQGDRRGPREDAAPARRGHDRRGQVGRDQRDALERAAARDPARGAARAGRPQAGRAQPLRVDPAPADARDHEPADGGERAAEPRQGDGAALRDHVAGAHAQPDRAEQGARASAAKRRCRTSSA